MPVKVAVGEQGRPGLHAHEELGRFRLLLCYGSDVSAVRCRRVVTGFSQLEQIDSNLVDRNCRQLDEAQVECLRLGLCRLERVEQVGIMELQGLDAEACLDRLDPVHGARTELRVMDYGVSGVHLVATAVSGNIV